MNIRTRTLSLFLLASVFIFSCKQEKKVPEQPADALQSIDPKHNLSPDERFGELFMRVQLDSFFPDSKTFVDCLPKMPTDSIMAAYDAQKKMPGFKLQDFVSQYFYLPTDTAKKNIGVDVGDASIMTHINLLWNKLQRPADTLNLGTLIPLPKPYIVPGGRFREVYYWDSYFSMLGLAAAEKTEMMENIIDNFAYLIDKIGFIPNGNRSYYLSRSQPPFFACMIQLLAAQKGDEVYVKYLPALEKEYKFWMNGARDSTMRDFYTKNHVVEVDGNVVNRYYDMKDTPRPEGYKEDVKAAKKTINYEKDMYRHLRSGAESGWDYSSRWFEDEKNIGTIRTTHIIPVDLNALLYNLESTIMKGKMVSKKFDEAAKFEKKMSSRREALRRYCWSASKGFYFDNDIYKYRQTEIYTLAAMYPLFFKMTTKREADMVAANIEKLFLRPGGVVTTLTKTGQQWDAPNGWAPLQWITIQGLRNYGHDSLANVIKTRWIDVNQRVYKATGKMMEKYNVEDMSLESGGGEYPSQDGFGWSNGVLQKLLSEKK